MNRFWGLMKAPPHKRYKNFVTTAADCEEIWLFQGDDWLVWPDKEFALQVVHENEVSCVEVHDFCNNYLPIAIAQSINIRVFPM